MLRGKRVARMRLTRRRFLRALGLGAAATGAYGLFLEPNRVSVTRHQLGTSAAARERVLRFVQLTDLHLHEVDGQARRIAGVVNHLQPDLVLLTGDAIDKQDRLRELGLFLDLLDPSTPKYATLGNWEHWAGVDLDQLHRVYAGRNCRLLVNETASLGFAGEEILITGLDDLTGGKPSITEALHGVEPRPFHLLLAHSPAYRDILPSDARAGKVSGLPEGEGIDLTRYALQYMLSGHTHGGQVALVGWAPFRPPGSGRYVSGWYRDGEPELYVSRGLGMSTLPVRLGAPPEVAHFEWALSPTPPRAAETCKRTTA